MMQGDEGSLTAPGLFAAKERRYFDQLVLVQLLLYPVAIALFGDRFRFSQDALSDLGARMTPSGQPNGLAAAVFYLMLVLIATTMFRYARYCGHEPVPAFGRAKRFVASMTAVGAIAAVSPNDTVHSLHVAGCVAMIGGFWVLGIIIALELSRHRSVRAAFLVQLLLEATLLPYAFAYAVNSDLKQMLQKPAIAGLVLSIWLGARILETTPERYHPACR